MNQNWHYIYIFPKELLLRAYSTLKPSLSNENKLLDDPVVKVNFPEFGKYNVIG